MKVDEEKALINIGPKSTACLNEVGIFTKSDLAKIGAVPAFIKMARECKSFKPSLNLLYGLVSVLEGIHWRDVAKHEKDRLLIELEGYKEFEAWFNHKTSE